jgi:hypothetical protein
LGAGSKQSIAEILAAASRSAWSHAHWASLR